MEFKNFNCFQLQHHRKYPESNFTKKWILIDHKMVNLVTKNTYQKGETIQTLSKVHYIRMHLDIGFAKDEVKTHTKKGGKTIPCLLLMHEYKYDKCKTKQIFPHFFKN